MASKGPNTSSVSPLGGSTPTKGPGGKVPVAAKSASVKPAATKTVAAKPIAAPVVASAPTPVVAPAPVMAAQPAPVAVAPVTIPEADHPVAAPVAAPIEKETTMETTVNDTAEKTQAQAKAMFSDVNDRAKSAMEKSSRMFTDMNDFSKGNLEAVVESGKIAAKGAEDIARYTSDYVRASVEKANATASQFAAIKSPTDFFKLQSEIAKDAMDQLMAETAKFTEGYVKLLGEVAQPISNRVALAAEKMKIAA